MKNFIIYLMIITFFIISAISFVYYDVTHIYEKDLLKNEDLFLLTDEGYVPIKNEAIDAIIGNEKYTWSLLPPVSYAYKEDIKSVSKNIWFRFHGEYLIVHYHSKIYGEVSIKSKNKLINIKERLKIK